jgi:hypothetical protein
MKSARMVIYGFDMAGEDSAACMANDIDGHRHEERANAACITIMRAWLTYLGILGRGSVI